MRQQEPWPSATTRCLSAGAEPETEMDSERIFVSQSVPDPRHMRRQSHCFGEIIRGIRERFARYREIAIQQLRMALASPPKTSVPYSRQVQLTPLWLPFSLRIPSYRSCSQSGDECSAPLRSNACSVSNSMGWSVQRISLPMVALLRCLPARNRLSISEGDLSSIVFKISIQNLRFKTSGVEF